MKRSGPIQRKTPLRKTLTPKTNFDGTPKEKPKKVKKQVGGVTVPSVAVLDKLFSEYIRARADWQCQFVGQGGIACSDQLQCSHIKSRRFGSLRWDTFNAISCCAAHHYWQHSHPDLNYKSLMVILGEQHMEDLQQAYLVGKKLTPSEKIEKATWLRAEIKRMKNQQ